MLREPDAKFLKSLDRFIEAMDRARAARERRMLEAKLERAIARAFLAQGKDFGRRLKALQHSYPIQEASRWSAWEEAFRQTAAATLALFVGPIGGAHQAAFLRGARAAAASIKTGIGFDLRHPRAEAFLAENPAAEKVAGINETTKAQLKTLIDRAVEHGWSYNRLALQISDTFTVFAKPQPQQHIRTRAELVAIQEVGEAYVAGTEAMGREMHAMGTRLEKHWSTMGDSRVSQTICAPNGAQGWIPFDSNFQSGHARPLGHVACRCDLMMRPARG